MYKIYTQNNYLIVTDISTNFNTLFNLLETRIGVDDNDILSIIDPKIQEYIQLGTYNNLLNDVDQPFASINDAINYLTKNINTSGGGSTPEPTLEQMTYKGTVDIVTFSELATGKKGDFYKINETGELFGSKITNGDSCILTNDLATTITSNDLISLNTNYVNKTVPVSVTGDLIISNTNANIYDKTTLIVDAVADSFIQFNSDILIGFSCDILVKSDTNVTIQGDGVIKTLTTNEFRNDYTEIFTKGDSLSAVIYNSDSTIVALTNISKYIHKAANRLLSLNKDTSIDFGVAGDDRGWIVKNGQLSVGSWDAPNEFIAGGGDSTTDTMLVFQKNDIGTFTDITDISKSDAGSSFDMIGGVEPDYEVYVGGDFMFGGVKVKIIADGIIEPDNIELSYWDGSKWQTINIMSTGSNSLIRHSNILAGSGEPSEHWYFDGNPWGVNLPWVKNIVDGVEKYWVKIKNLSTITSQPVLEQIKLHTNRFEVNPSNGVQFFGTHRYHKDILSGINSLLNNSVYLPSNRSVDYTPDITVPYLNNRFRNNTIDSKVFVLDIDERIDTSIPVQLALSYYIEGTQTGGLNFNINSLPIQNGFLYDGTGTIDPQGSYIDSIATDSNLIRRTMNMYVDISKADEQTAYVVELRRDATGGNTNDTLQTDIVLTHLNIAGYCWKL